jgi:outer membrane immunogenic protein
MKKLLVAGVAAATLCGASAFAADLPTKAVEPATLFNWSGMYAGIDGGWADQHHNFAFDPPVGGGANQTGRESSSGGMWGAHIGIQQQFGAWVLGVEGAVDGLGDRTGHSVCGTTASDCRIWTDRIWTVGPRLGYAVNNALFFVNGGYANGDTTVRFFNAAGAIIQVNEASRQGGWYIGGGVDYVVAKNFVVGIEYQHVDLGTKFECTTAVVACVIPSTNNMRVSATADIVKASATWKFGPPFGAAN